MSQDRDNLHPILAIIADKIQRFKRGEQHDYKLEVRTYTNSMLVYLYDKSKYLHMTFEIVQGTLCLSSDGSWPLPLNCSGGPNLVLAIGDPTIDIIKTAMRFYQAHRRDCVSYFRNHP